MVGVKEVCLLNVQYQYDGNLFRELLSSSGGTYHVPVMRALIRWQPPCHPGLSSQPLEIHFLTHSPLSSRHATLPAPLAEQIQGLE